MECGWPNILGTVNMAAASWRMPRNQTLKPGWGFQAKRRGDEKALGWGRAWLVRAVTKEE